MTVYPTIRLSGYCSIRLSACPASNPQEKNILPYGEAWRGLLLSKKTVYGLLQLVLLHGTHGALGHAVLGDEE